MNRGPVHLIASVVLATAVMLLIAGGQRQNDLEDLQQQRAIRIARTLAWEAARSDSAPLRRTVAALPSAVPGLQSALVLRGRTLVAHSEPTRAARALEQDRYEDKELYDQAARLRAAMRKNDDERERTPTLAQDAYAEVESRWLANPVRLAVSVPVEDGREFKAMAAVEVLPVHPPAPWPWTLLAMAALVAIVGVPIARRSSGVRLVATGAVLLAGLLAADTWLLVRWREALRREVVAEQVRTVGAMASAGVAARAGTTTAMARPDPLDSPGISALAAVLASDAAHRPTGDFLAVRPASAMVTPGATPMLAGAIAVDVAESFFTAARTTDLRHVAQWALAVWLLAVSGFVLGVRGRLRAGWDAAVEHGWAYAYLAPAMIGLLVLVFVPMTFGLVLGFMERRYNAFEFVGLANYVAILSDFNLSSPDNFFVTLGVTILWTVLNVALHLGLGLGLALLLNDQLLRARGIYRVLLVVPWAIPNYITALIWKGLFHKQFGAVNFALEALGMEPVAWFQQFWPAFTTNVVTNTWLGFPFMMLVSLGALASIPTDLYEAAWVDGANRWQRFRHVTLPLLLPALVPAVIVGTVWTFNMFNIIYLVSGGAPDGATDILITEAFRWAFERDRYGYAAAYSTLIFLLLLAFTLVTNRLTGATKGALE